MSPKYEQMADFDAASGADEMEREARALDESDLSDATQARPEDMGLFDAAARMSSSVLVSPAPLPPPAVYAIVDETTLRRAFGAIRHARRRLEQNKRMQAPEIEAVERELFLLKQMAARANKALEEEIAFKERAITVYAQLHRKDVLGSEEPRKGEKKTRDYGIGRISYRATGGEYRWRQDMTPKEREEALLRWAKEINAKGGPCMFYPVERPDVEAAKLYAEADTDERGEWPPPGLEWVEPGESISVKVGEEK